MYHWEPSPPTRSLDAQNRRQQRRAATIRGYGDSVTSAPPPVASPSTDSINGHSMMFSRPGIFGGTPAITPLQRHRLRRPRIGDSFGTVQETVNDLDNDQRMPHLTSGGLHQTLPVPTEVDEFTALPEATDTYGRRNKRRKLDADPLDAPPKINYGYHGQVAPGRLNMMISYCDGGHMYEDAIYSQDNLLHNDKSVYCSRKNKVDLMLSHLGELPFTCSKIVIKTPVGLFPAAIQEGMVFLFMGEDHMLENTSLFQIRDTCPHHTRNLPSSQRRTRTTISRRMRMRNGAWEVEDLDTYPELEEFDFGPFIVARPTTQTQPSPLRTSQEASSSPRLTRRRVSPLHARSAYEENIEVSCDPPSGDDEETTTEAVLEDRNRRARQAETDNGDTEEEDDDEPMPYVTGPRGRDAPRPIEWTGKDPTVVTNQPKPPGPDVPYTRFFIGKRKEVVTIKFDPPVSAKHILFKLWGPQGKDGLDLQSISVYGFAGPRFFPVTLTF